MFPRVTGSRFFTKKLPRVSPSAAMPYSILVKIPAMQKYILATLCSKPQITNKNTGQKLISSFPATPPDAKDAHTAMQTKILQPMPRIKASVKVRLTFAEAMLTMDSASLPPNISGVWPYTTSNVTKMAPIKLPKNTQTQFFIKSRKRIFFSSSAMITRLSPVKSSLPAISTMASPAGNTRPLTTFAIDPSKVADAAVDAIPPKAINIPAKIPNSNVFVADIFPFLAPMST